MQKLLKYVFNILLSFDRFVNAILGGDPEMTLSGRMGRTIREGHCVLCKGICKILNYFDKNHCLKQSNIEAKEGSDALWR